MSVSIYYTASKNSALTSSEREKIKSILDRFNNNYA